jgi:hypothetical protein
MGHSTGLLSAVPVRQAQGRLFRTQFAESRTLQDEVSSATCFNSTIVPTGWQNANPLAARHFMTSANPVDDPLSLTRSSSKSSFSVKARGLHIKQLHAGKQPRTWAAESRIGGIAVGHRRPLYRRKREDVENHRCGESCGGKMDSSRQPDQVLGSRVDLQLESIQPLSLRQAAHRGSQ